MRVLFIDSVHPILKERLEKSGMDCVSGETLSKQEVLAQISDFQGIVIRSKFIVDREFLKKASSLRFIARSGSGLENIDLETARKKGITIFNSPEGNRNAVAEHAIGMLMSLFNNLNNADREVRNGLWQREANRGIELEGKKVGLLGYGNTGQAFARVLSGFGCSVYAYDKYLKSWPDENAISCNVKTIQKECDILSLHLPLTKETNGWIDHDFMVKFSKPFYLINTSRGPIVKTRHLVEGIKSGKILGACLDVLEYEESSFELSSAITNPDL
jgi:D-3-phosphoglycerate dehydrogenase